ncbi:hypothetical protein PVOR_08990 [Paenibacillus vortex V453]|uniref:Uncharacterized protein n=1 Tax=Paenibacillus vortex V453 TaxID=715225 RepID=A0A2R9SYB2_9BACL|nr:hypothetical protein PVOR_08990 [Paenibacillus vortex V453]
MIKNRLSKVGIPVDSLFFCGVLLVFLMGGLILFKQLQYILNTLCNRLQLKLTLPGMGNRGRFL